jgi:uncharacterized protein YaaW (UPF0174 family)
MSDSRDNQVGMLANLITDLGSRVDALAASVAVLQDRRTDLTDALTVIAANQVRITALEHDLVARKAKASLWAALAAGGGIAGGAIAPKLLALLGAG